MNFVMQSTLVCSSADSRDSVLFVCAGVIFVCLLFYWPFAFLFFFSFGDNRPTRAGHTRAVSRFSPTRCAVRTRPSPFLAFWFFFFKVGPAGTDPPSRRLRWLRLCGRHRASPPWHAAGHRRAGPPYGRGTTTATFPLFHRPPPPPPFPVPTQLTAQSAAPCARFCGAPIPPRAVVVVPRCAAAAPASPPGTGQPPHPVRRERPGARGSSGSGGCPREAHKLALGIDGPGCTRVGPLWQRGASSISPFPPHTSPRGMGGGGEGYATRLWFRRRTAVPHTPGHGMFGQKSVGCPQQCRGTRGAGARRRCGGRGRGAARCRCLVRGSPPPRAPWPPRVCRTARKTAGRPLGWRLASTTRRGYTRVWGSVRPPRRPQRQRRRRAGRLPRPGAAAAGGGSDTVVPGVYLPAGGRRSREGNAGPAHRWGGGRRAWRAGAWPGAATGPGDAARWRRPRPSSPPPQLDTPTAAHGPAARCGEHGAARSSPPPTPLSDAGARRHAAAWSAAVGWCRPRRARRGRGQHVREDTTPRS